MQLKSPLKKAYGKEEIIFVQEAKSSLFIRVDHSPLFFNYKIPFTET
jgi:hypothetical protein